MMFVEVNSVQPKNCKLIVNLENIVEIAPLVQGGCVLFFNSLEAGVSKTITVSDSYNLFKQFVLQTVTPESIEKRFPTKKTGPLANIKAQEEGKGVQFSDSQYGEAK
jgi:hypothetical protein